MRLPPLIAGCVCVLPLSTPCSALAAEGALRPLGGEGACFRIAPPAGCTKLRGPGERGRRWLLARDGRTVYGSGGNAIVTLARDADTGRLRQLRGRAGCLRPDGGRGCRRARGLSAPGAFVVWAMVESPDGRHLYVLANRAIMAFRREGVAGRLRQLEGAAGCWVPRRRDGCGVLPALRGGPMELGISPDGRTLALATALGVSAFLRATDTGALTFIGCFGRGARCRSVPPADHRHMGLGAGTAEVHFSPDGRWLDVLFSGRYAFDIGEIEEGAVLTFRRDGTTGAIEPLAPPAGCLAAEDPPRGCHEATGVSFVLGGLAEAGTDVYLASYADSPSIVHLLRDEATGALVDTPGGCLAEVADTECRGIGGIAAPEHPLLSTDGRSLYLLTAPGGDFGVFFGAVTVLQRDLGSGAITPLGARRGCLGVPRGVRADHRCRPVSDLRHPAAMTLSADGRNAYVFAWTSESLLSLARRADGSLDRLPGSNGCRKQRATRRCGSAAGLRAPGWIDPSLAMSPDDRFVYLFAGGALVFQRR